MSWPCPWQVATECRRRGMKPCEPGAEGCVLAGRFEFPLKKKDKNLRSSVAERSGSVRASDVALAADCVTGKKNLRSSVAERGKTARARRGKADSR